jgi:hypothetical protein
MLGDAYAVFPSPRYSAEAARVRGWLRHLQTRVAYVTAYEQYYRSVKLGLRLQMLDRTFRTLTGRRTRKMVGGQHLPLGVVSQVGPVRELPHRFRVAVIPVPESDPYMVRSWPT